MNEHDYNVLVYNLVDNAVEDLAVRTTKQDTEELCVEAEGYIHPDSILQAMAEQTESEPDADSRETMTDIVNEVNTSYSEIEGGKPEVIPPTDETELAKHKAPESDALPPAAAVQASGSATVAALPVSEPAPQDDKRGLVYVEPTEFLTRALPRFTPKRSETCLPMMKIILLPTKGSCRLHYQNQSSESKG